jgi:hypothetical protein
MEKRLVENRWFLRRISKLYGFEQTEAALAEYAAELALYLGIARRSEGRTDVECYAAAEGAGVLVSITAEIDHARTRGPAAILPTDGSLVDWCGCVVAAFGQSDYCLLTTDPAGARSGGGGLCDRVVAWLERRFDCYCDPDPAGAAVSSAAMSRLAAHWALLAARETDAASSSVALAVAPPPGVKGVSRMALEIPLAAVVSALSAQDDGDAQQGGGQDLVSAIAGLCRAVCGMDLRQLTLEGVSTHVAALSCDASFEVHSPRLAETILRDLCTTLF